MLSYLKYTVHSNCRALRSCCVSYNRDQYLNEGCTYDTIRTIRCDRESLNDAGDYNQSISILPHLCLLQAEVIALFEFRNSV